MVAFVGSLIVTAVMVGLVVAYAKRRPVGTPVTWGEAMIAAAFVFALMVWVYGIVPDRFLAWADNELGWRPDRIFVGPGGFFSKDKWLHLPFTITFQVIRDLLVVVLYGVLLVGHVALWSLWQNRGKQASTEVQTTQYGRPLVKSGS